MRFNQKETELLHGKSFAEVVDLGLLRRLHPTLYEKATQVQKDGNEAAAIASLQFWRSPIYAGFPITPSTKWIETVAAKIHSGKFVITLDGRKVSTKKIKQLEAEHAVADYMVGAAAACRDL
ncbi:MAG: hypothetical protein HY539_01115, partial [Deltaproteobacteria bacterium]|nr:hypothetical protein [Deltaproteobacteria bacterium]